MPSSATSKNHSGPQPATGSMRSPNPRLDTSRATTHLSPSEIESLKKDDQEARKIIRETLAQ